PVFESVKTAFVVPETAFTWKESHRFWHLLVQSKTPISLDALAAALRSSREQVKAVFEQLPETEYDQFGNLLGMGLTLKPTIHQVVLDGHPCSAWCGPDTMELPVVLKRPARFLSRCPSTGGRSEPSFTTDHVESLSPEATVVSIVKTGDRLKQFQDAGCIPQGGCNHQFFFANPEAAAPW